MEQKPECVCAMATTEQPKMDPSECTMTKEEMEAMPDGQCVCKMKTQEA